MGRIIESAERSEGYNGSMEADEFVRLVNRNKLRTDFRFVRNREGARTGAPPNTFTLVIGEFNDGNAYNIPVGRIPEFTTINPDNTIKERGWRALLQYMLTDHVILPNEEILKILGPKHFFRCVGHALSDGYDAITVS